MPSSIELLAIGNELLLGETVDTNASWIGRRLAMEGIRVVRKTTVGDDVAHITDALGAALRRTKTVICTGGLGPTRDDMTRDAVTALYGRKTHTDEGWLTVLRERYAKRGIPMPEINRVQAERPEGATFLFNARGTAPGITIDDAALGLTVLLPGVPGEMRGLMDEHVVPLLRARFVIEGTVESRVLRTAGLSEAALAEMIDDIASDVAPLTLAFLPHTAGVDLRLTCWGDVPPADVSAAFERVAPRLKDRLGMNVYADDQTDLAVVVGRLLRKEKLTLALAESCTGGLVSKRMTDEGGASEYMAAGFVTYSNEAKREFLGVTTETLAMHGAVSERCAREMAQGARRAGSADVGASITGIAGPSGGSHEKPVGTVWFGVSMSDELAKKHGHASNVITKKLVLPGDRSDIRERAAQLSLDMVRRALMEQP